MTKIADLSPAQILAVFNHYADKPVARFTSAAIGRARLIKLLAPIDAPECKAIAAALAPAEAPDPDWTPDDVGFGDKAEFDERATAQPAKATKAPAKRARGAKPGKAKPTAKPSAKPARARPAPATAKDVSKKDQAIALLTRKKGVSGKELAETLGWLPHTTRGFISRLGQTMTIVAERTEDGGTVYRAS